MLKLKMLFAPAGEGGGDPNPNPNPNPNPTPKVGDPNPAKGASQDGDLSPVVKAYIDQKFGAVEKVVKDVDGKVSKAEQERQAERQAAATTTAAQKAGAKDTGYFEYLANQARAAEGDKFDLAAFTAKLKGERGDLFEQPKAATTGAGAPALPVGEVDALKAKLQDAEKKGDVLGALRIRTELQKAGVKA